MDSIFRDAHGTFGGVITTEYADVRLQSGSELLAQTVAFAYSQRELRVYEIGLDTTYFVAGKTSGELRAARLVGPRRSMSNFYSTYGDVCKALTNIADFSMIYRPTGDEAHYSAECFIVTATAMILATSDMAIAASTTATFANLQYVGS